MDNRSLALRYLSEAVNMDGIGNRQAAFAKYLQSLHVLTMYLNDLFATLGFQKMLEKNQEIKQVLSMVRECSDRVAVIVDTSNTNTTSETVNKKNSIIKVTNNDVESPLSQKFPAFEKLQAENMRLLKQYQWRCERSNDNRAKTNLRLELERQLVENAIIAKRKYDMAVKQLQKERVQLMEKQMKALLENRQQLTAKQKEKQELYLSVFQYTKTETWTWTWKLNPLEMSAAEAIQQIFQKTIRCSQHPLSQWLLVIQTNLKREIEAKLKIYSDYKALPDLLLDKSMQCFRERSTEFVIKHEKTGTITVSKKSLKSLQEFLESVALELTNTIENVLEIFYLIYKSLLPEDSEEICHRLIETHILEPLWSSFILLFRISNISSEYKISQTMLSYEASNPRKFGFSSEEHINPEVCTECVSLLKNLPNHQSLTEKLKILVEVCQIICGTPSHTNVNQRKLGADDLMPLLCYVIVKSGMPQLGSECYAIEQIFDMKYMFGEEGYALSSFLTGLKYIEVRMGMEEKIDNNEAL